MDKKKKHSIIWLVVIVVAILAIVLITIAGNNRQTNTAYADEIETEENTTGIDSITVSGSGSNIEPTQELYLEWTQNSESIGNEGRALITTVKDFLPKTYTIKIAFIGNPLRVSSTAQYQNLGIGFINNSQTNHYITKNNTGITEDNYSVTITTQTNQFYLQWFSNFENIIVSGTYWINILQLQIYDSSNNYIVNYQSYLYEYLKGQFDNSYSSGYESGITDGESLYRNNPFNGATLVSAITEENSYSLKNTNINVLSNGIDFSNIQQAADNYFQTNSIDNRRFTVTLNTIPFVFEQNQIYVTISYGFYSLYFTDTNNNRYLIDQSSSRTTIGYPLEPTSSSAYGKSIKQIEITFANTDYVGGLRVGRTSAQDSAYQEGYNKGQSDGYQEGFSDAVAEGNGPMQSISKLISTVSAGLNVDLIGPISIGDILNVALGILLTFAVIRFFGGG